MDLPVLHMLRKIEKKKQKKKEHQTFIERKQMIDEGKEITSPGKSLITWDRDFFRIYTASD